MKNRKSGFTLLEMLVVIGILGMLMALAFTGMTQAQRQARVAKANSEIRNLLTAWLSYESAHDDWPGQMPSDPVDVTEQLPAMMVLLGKAPDKRGELKVYFNVQMKNGAFRDPWGNPYRVKVTPQDKVPEISDHFSATVTFPNRSRPKW